MPLVVYDRVRETTSVTGTSDAVLLGAVTGFQSFAVVGNGNTCYYTISAQGGSEWEVGIGTYNTTGPTLERTTILSSSNSNNKVVFSAGTKDVFLTYPASTSVNTDRTNTFTEPQVISTNSSTDALRITQTGTGNALVVEDSANPDSSPFVVDANGQVGIGTGTPGGILTVNSDTATTVRFQRNSSDASAPQLIYIKQRGTLAAPVSVNSSDGLGATQYFGYDGTTTLQGARIDAAVDGAPGTGSMPGRLTFSTTPSGSSTPTERMRIDSAGRIGIGATSLSGYVVRNSVNPTGATTVRAFRADGTIQTDVTAAYISYGSVPSTAASSSLTDLVHFSASRGNTGAGSTLTNQKGFEVESLVIGATNNYGFFSNIAAGTGRFNFYAAGTAVNYFAGNTLVGTLTNTNSSTLVSGGTISETVSSVQYPVASQFDVGTAPNKIPLNQYLGALAYKADVASPLDVGTGITTGTGTICKANGGLDGGIYKVQIIVDLTGLNSGGTAGDIIGVNGTALPCYIARLPAMTVLGGRMTCLEAPAGGDTDIDLYSATEGTGVEDQAISALTETEIINAGTQSRGTVTYFSADPAANSYLYFVGQSTSNATYTAGRFLIEIFGVQ